jgi:DNA-binding NtrC family response regulator
MSHDHDLQLEPITGEVDEAEPHSVIPEQEPEERIIPLKELERKAITDAMRIMHGSVGRAAEALGIGRATLYRRLKTLHLDYLRSANTEK